MIKSIVVPLAVAGVLAAGCGHPLIPAADLKPQPKITRPVAPYLSAPVVPYKVQRSVLGVDLYAPRNYTQAQTFTFGVRTINYIKTVLHAKAVGILWDYYSPSRTTNVVQATKRGTLTVADVMTLTKIAKRAGLQVEYRPLIFIPSHQNNPWEGMLKPPNQQKFFSNYFSALWPYIKAAQKLHISEFVTATEMHALNGSRLWKSFFTRVGKTYHGVVSYTAFYRDYFRPTGHLLPVRLYGMDMYKALPLKFNATQAQVTAAWEASFKTVPAAVLARTALDEEGLAARAGAYSLPPNLGAPGRLDQAVQARWFTAACKTVARFHMRAVYFFKVNLADNPAEPSKALSVFEGRKGAVAISACAKLFG
jgi:hypothetical protein